MPTARWKITAADVDDYDRSGNITPYVGPTPRNGIYEWLITTLFYMPATSDKHPSLRIGLELAPREDRKGEAQYEGFRLMTFIPVMPKTAWRYVPFLDSIGVSGDDFTIHTIVDAEGKITRIGKWRQDGEQYILAELTDSDSGDERYPKDIRNGRMWPIPDDDDSDDGDDSDVGDDEEEVYEDDDSAF